MSDRSKNLSEGSRRYQRTRKIALAYNEGFTPDQIKEVLGEPNSDPMGELVEYVQHRRQLGHDGPVKTLTIAPFHGAVFIFLQDLRRKFKASKRPYRPFDGTLESLPTEATDVVVVQLSEKRPSTKRSSIDDERMEVLVAVYDLMGLLERFLTSEREREAK